MWWRCIAASSWWWWEWVGVKMLPQQDSVPSVWGAARFEWRQFFEQSVGSRALLHSGLDPGSIYSSAWLWLLLHSLFYLYLSLISLKISVSDVTENNVVFLVNMDIMAACCAVWNLNDRCLCSSYGAVQLSEAEHVCVFSCRLDSLEGEVLLNIMAETSMSFLLSIFKTWVRETLFKRCPG